MVFVTRNIFLFFPLFFFANEQNRDGRRGCFTNFTLGPAVICIYIESIRFWFIIVTNLGWGQGTRGGGVSSRRSVTCYEALVHEHPYDGGGGDNYGAFGYTCKYCDLK